jgi:hypothetical protein
MQGNSVTRGQGTGMFVQVEQELMIQARLAAGVFQLDRAEPVPDGGVNNRFDRRAPYRVIHFLG